MTTIRVAVAGLGIGWLHAAAVKESTNVSLVALCDHDAGQRDRAAREFPDVPCFPSLTELLERVPVDIVVIATYDRDHAVGVIDAVQRGIHCFVEKPLATTRGDLAAIVEALNNRPEVALASNTLLRRSPRFVALAERVGRGDLGDIYYAEADYLYGRITKLLDGWRGTHDDYSVTLGGAIHVIDLVVWLLQDLPEEVVAIGSSTAGRILSGHPTWAIDDLRVALFTFASGRTAKVGANFACVVPHFHRVELYGTRGTYLQVPHGRPESTAGDQPGWLFSSRDPDQPPAGVTDPYPAVDKALMLGEFIEHVRGNTPGPISAQEVVNATAIGLAVDESVRTRRAIAVDYPSVEPRRLA